MVNFFKKKKRKERTTNFLGENVKTRDTNSKYEYEKCKFSWQKCTKIIYGKAKSTHDWMNCLSTWTRIRSN